MVENPGETLYTDTHKPVNAPGLIKVEADANGLPVAVRLPRRQAITSIEDLWRIDDEWWRSEPVSRLYYHVRLTSGQRLVLYHDLIDNRWYRQSY